MKQILAILLTFTFGHSSWAQCASTPILKYNGSLCAGLDTLFVSSPDIPYSITWYIGSGAVATAYSVTTKSANATTVAGGNGQGGAADQLNNPSQIAVDSKGYLYVADILNSRVLKFPPGSTSATDGVTVAGGNGLGTATNQMQPSGLAIDASGNLYVADTWNSRVIRFPPGSTAATAGTTVAGGNGFGSAANQMEPTGICFDLAGNMYVSDYGNSRILRFPPNSTSATFGTVVAGGNGIGPAANQLAGCYGLLLDPAGNLYVADQSNCRIQKFPPGSTSITNGLTVAGGNGPGFAANQLLDPTFIYLDAGGNLYVDDDLGYRIQEYPPGSTSSTNGITVAAGNGAGDAADQFNNSYGMDLDAKGFIYVSDAINNRVQKYAFTVIDTIYIPKVPGTYSAVVTDPTGCSETTNDIVIKPLPPPPAVSIAADQIAVCAGDTVTFRASPVNAGASPDYQWQINGADVGIDNDTLVTAGLSNGDIVSCILTSTIGCTSPVASTNTIAMTVNPIPQVRFNPDTQTIRYGQTTTLAPLISAAISVSQWSPSTALNNPGIPDPAANPVESTTYTLIVQSDAGCTGSGKTTIVVYSSPSMPNAFTPNADGRNDVFRIPPNTPQQIQRLSVYDRWGSCVFTTTDGSKGWDGTANGHPQPAGTYVWMLLYRDPITQHAESAKGTVLLIR